MRNFDRQNSRGKYRNKYRNEGYEQAETGLEKCCFPEAITTIKVGVQALVGPGQDQEQVANRDRIRFVEVDFLWNRTVDSLKTSFHLLL